MRSRGVLPAYPHYDSKDYRAAYPYGLAVHPPAREDPPHSTNAAHKRGKPRASAFAQRTREPEVRTDSLLKNEYQHVPSQGHGALP